MHHTEITAVAKLNDIVNFIYTANNHSSNITGELISITPYDITVKIKKLDLYGFEVMRDRDYSLGSISNFTSQSSDFDLGL